MVNKTILLIGIGLLLAGCGTSQEKQELNIDGINAEQEKMVKEGRAQGAKDKESTYKQYIDAYFESQEGLNDEN